MIHIYKLFLWVPAFAGMTIILFLTIIPQTVFAGEIGLDVGTNYTRMTISGINSPDLFQYLGIRWIRTLDPNLKLQPIKGEETNILAVYPYNCKDTSEEKENAFIKAVINNASVKAVEIGNEPNIEETDKFSGKNKDFDCPPEVFGDQVIRMYNQLNPSGRQVIFGGLFIKDSLHANLYNMNPDTPKNYVTPYITQVMAYFRNKRTNPWDAIGLHFYVNEDGSKDSSYILSKYQSYIAAIRKITGSLPIWVTEYGWRSDYAQMNDTKQAEFLKTTSNWFKANGNVEMAFWYSQIDSRQHDIIQTLGIYDAAQELLKPSFFALKNVQGSLTACAEALEPAACSVAGPELKSCTYCSSKKSCVDSQDPAACPAQAAPPAAPPAQSTRVPPPAPTAIPPDQKAKQDANSGPLKGLVQDPGKSYCVYLNSNSCSATSNDCQLTDGVCLPQAGSVSEEDNRLYRFYGGDKSKFSKLLTETNSNCKNDQECKESVIAKCTNEWIKDSNINPAVCTRDYFLGKQAEILTKATQDTIEKKCNEKPKNVPGFNPQNCIDNNYKPEYECHKKNVYFDDFELCFIAARQEEINRVTRAAAKPAGEPADDFCNLTDDICWTTFEVCKGPDTEGCMANYGYRSYTAPLSVGSAPAAGIGITPLPVKTDTQCNNEYHEEYKKRNGRNDYYCDGNSCVLHQEISNGIGGCTQGTPLFDQDQPECPLACQKTAAKTPLDTGSESTTPTPQEVLLSNCHTKLTDKSDQTDCINNFQDQAQSCPADDVNGCVEGLTAEWIKQKLQQRSRISTVKQICLKSNSCYQKLSDTCTPEDLSQRDQTSFNNCVEDFQINNPIKDRRWQVSIVNASCAKYFGPGNPISDRCVADADSKCWDHIIENDFTSCVDEVAMNMGAVKGQGKLYKVSINCPAEDGYAGEKIIYLGNLTFDQTFNIPDGVNQLVCELKEYYANFTTGEDGIDENGNKLQTVIFTNKEIPAPDSAESAGESGQPPAEEAIDEKRLNLQLRRQQRLEGEGQGCTYEEEGEPFCPAGQKHTCHGVYNDEGICVYKEGVNSDCTLCE